MWAWAPSAEPDTDGRALIETNVPIRQFIPRIRCHILTALIYVCPHSFFSFFFSFFSALPSLPLLLPSSLLAASSFHSLIFIYLFIIIFFLLIESFYHYGMPARERERERERHDGHRMQSSSKQRARL